MDIQKYNHMINIDGTFIMSQTPSWNLPFFILLKPYDVGLIISLICAEEKNEAEWPEVTEQVGRPELWLPPKPVYVL